MPKKKTKTNYGKITDQKWLGKEPEFGKSEVTNIQINNAYNWYNYFHDYNDSKSFTLEYFGKNKENEKVCDILSGVNPQWFGTLGWICRMQSRGAKLSKETIEFRNTKLKSLIGLKDKKLIQSDPSEENGEEVEEPKNVIAERMSEKAATYIGDIEVEVDKFTKTYSSTFRAFDWLNKRQVKVPFVKRIGEYYKELQTELNKAITKSDDQITEAYSGFKKPELKKYYDFITSIVADCNQYMVGAKQTQKPRKKKIKSAEQLVAKLKYQKADNQYKLNSIDPKNIVQSTQLWVFNTKKRLLGTYVPGAGGVLNIKGSTIVGFDPKLSIQKKVRKPDQILTIVTQGGKVALRTVMDDIVARPSPLSGRINGDTVLLKATK